MKVYLQCITIAVVVPPNWREIGDVLTFEDIEFIDGILLTPTLLLLISGGF